MTRSHTTTRLLIWTVLVCAPLAGCQHVRLPAIDKSGRRIFLPPPNYTTLNTASEPGALVPGPQPAFTAPPHPPPCSPAELAAPTFGDTPAITAPALPQSLGTQSPAPGQQRGLARRGREGAIIVAPGRIIAPVGSDVVLMAGLCGPDGYFVTRQPIEWMLSQDSVGNFVDAGESGHQYFTNLLHRETREVSGNHATTRSSTRAELITRGTPSPNDDVWVREGQSWVSLTSATEGTSHVTVFAPKASSWDRRRQTATVHWVDAQWELPPTAIVRAGQQHQLVTRVTRGSSGTPAVGWTVRYEVVGGGVPAGFAPSGAASVDVTTLADGTAPATIISQTNQPGTTQVRVHIIRPAQQSGDLPQLNVGQGWTSVTWSAPGLTLNASGPQLAQIGSVVTYRVEVSNPGDMATDDVVVFNRMPAGLELISSNPPGRMLGNSVEWRFAQLPPHGTQSITVDCRANQSGVLRHCFTARSAQVAEQERCVDTQVYAPSLKVDIQQLPRTEFEVGETVEFRIEVANEGEVSLANAVATIEADAGLEHEENPQFSKLARKLGTLQPRTPVQFASRYRVTKTGTLCIRLQVTADGGNTAIQQRCITGVQPARPQANPAVDVQASGPAERRVGEVARYDLTVKNTGNVPLTNVQIVFSMPPSLNPAQATPGHRRVENRLVWDVARLEPGQTQPYAVECQCLRADAAARSQATVAADQEVSDSADAQTRIVAAPAPPVGRNGQPPTEPPMDPPMVTGDLEVTVNALDNPIVEGGQTTYLIQIKNDRNASDREVEVTLVAPVGMRIDKVTGPMQVPVKSASPDKRTWVIVYNELRAREAVTIEATATGLRPGDQTFRAQVKSMRSPQFEKQETITVNPK